MMQIEDGTRRPNRLTRSCGKPTKIGSGVWRLRPTFSEACWLVLSLTWPVWLPLTLILLASILGACSKPPPPQYPIVVQSQCLADPPPLLPEPKGVIAATCPEFEVCLTNKGATDLGLWIAKAVTWMSNAYKACGPK